MRMWKAFVSLWRGTFKETFSNTLKPTPTYNNQNTLRLRLSIKRMQVKPSTMMWRNSTRGSSHMRVPMNRKEVESSRRIMTSMLLWMRALIKNTLTAISRRAVWPRSVLTLSGLMKGKGMWSLWTNNSGKYCKGWPASIKGQIIFNTMKKRNDQCINKSLRNGHLAVHKRQSLTTAGLMPQSFRGVVD